jgi:DNA-binding response OmpR family regulator
VLVVADDAPMVALICTILAEAGSQVVIVANTARQAEDAIATRAPGLVLLDLRLLDADGVPVIEGARARDFDGPIVVLAAAPRDDEVVRALRAGADGYLLKEDLHQALAGGLGDVSGGGDGW